MATQMGIQIHAGENYRRVVEMIQSGAIGPVREVHVWVSRAWGWQSKEEAEQHKDIVWVTERPAEVDPVPEGLHWDLWLGPAPARPFNKIYYPGPQWYRWWDFGNGTMSDLGSHYNDLPFWALKLNDPLTIEASGPPPHPEIAPASMQATYEFGPRGDLPPVTMTWYQGVNKPEIWQQGQIPQWGSGHLFIGDEGMLLSDYGKHVLLPEDKFARLPAARTLHPARRLALRGLAQRRAKRHAGQRQLRILGSVDRSEPPGQRGLPRGQETAVGRRQHEGHQCAGSRCADPLPLPRRMDALRCALQSTGWA